MTSRLRKKIFTRRNFFYFIQFCVLLFGISFPFWQTTEVFHIYRPLWIIVPGFVFVICFALAFGTLFELSERTLKFFKKIIGYWLAGGFILFVTILCLLFINIFFAIPQYIMFSSGLVIATILIMYSYHHAKYVFVHSFSLTSSKITKKYTFIQLSDIHIGSNGKHEVERILEKLTHIDYDFVVITGDLIDEDYATYEALEPLSNITTPIYYITGNHEYYLRHTSFKQFIKKTDINDINDKKVSFGELDLYGIDEKSDAEETLTKLAVDTQKYAIGLMHEPHAKEMDKAKRQGIDLMLSGHTHNGQIFPFTLMVRARYKFLKGLYQRGNMSIYVNQGTGTWGPKMRLRTKNEITVITLIPKK
jgi:hypothetical protein